MPTLSSDKRKKPITKKSIKIKSVSFTPAPNLLFKKGGFIAKGCGKVMKNRRKITKIY